MQPHAQAVLQRRALFTEERLFLFGPAEDRNKDGMLGSKRPEGNIPNVDQGLAIWAYDLSLHDHNENDGAKGLERFDTVALELAFAHTRPSTYTEGSELATCMPILV